MLTECSHLFCHDCFRGGETCELEHDFAFYGKPTVAWPTSGAFEQLTNVRRRSSRSTSRTLDRTSRTGRSSTRRRSRTADDAESRSGSKRRATEEPEGSRPSKRLSRVVDVRDREPSPEISLGTDSQHVASGNDSGSEITKLVSDLGLEPTHKSAATNNGNTDADGDQLM